MIATPRGADAPVRAWGTGRLTSDENRPVGSVGQIGRLDSLARTAELERQRLIRADDVDHRLGRNLIFDSHGPILALTNSRRRASFSKSTDEPMVVVKLRAGLPLSAVRIRLQATGIIGLFFGPRIGLVVGFMPSSTCPRTSVVQSAGSGNRTA